MTTELSPMATVQQKIQEKIKDEFMNLIPDEMFKEMVNTVVKDFTQPRTHDQYGRSTGNNLSPMGQMIRKQIEERTQAMVKESLDELFTSAYNHQTGRQVVSGAMVKMIEENYEAILTAVQKGQIDLTVHTAMNSLRQSLMR